MLDLDIKTVKVIDIKDDDTIIKCLKKDPSHDTEEALKDIYRRLRPGDPPTVTNAKALLKRLFFDPKRYDIGRVGRYKINQKLSIDVDLDTRIITNEDIVAATQYVINLRRGEGSNGRYRPPRQPPRADRGGIARKPVPDGSVPHRATG